MHPLEKKMPRHHEGLAWEAENLHNDFTDITRLALDDDFGGKVGAPLSKRRNGVGPTDGRTPGLFGIQGSNSSSRGNLTKIVAVSAIIYFLFRR